MHSSKVISFPELKVADHDFEVEFDVELVSFVNEDAGQFKDFKEQVIHVILEKYYLVNLHGSEQNHWRVFHRCMRRIGDQMLKFLLFGMGDKRKKPLDIKDFCL
ncbi:hypothetical protein [Fervidibacillus halotolerans]|uniref:Uncharacterized protein n=1 Tax=Fervidibacillus halotolerans TaxID=2980027 RepID=A0A9E8RYU7_9BACI|nr:hypothetical protein [Fervidibacillus halotolerans]WAA13201.1 hypothetical protein OE105_03475 [Fervidibacillus halotolerans]